MPAERLGWLALVGALALFFLIGVPLQMLSTGVGIWFTELFLFFGFGWALTRWSGRAPGPYLGLSWPGGWPLALALGVAVANYFAAVIPLQFLAQLVAPRSWVEMFDQTQVFERQTGIELVLAMTGAVAAAPIGEEVIFRGLLLQGLLRRGVAVLPAVVAAAAIFSLCHVNIVGLPALFELGVVFGLLYVRTRSVLPGMVAHLGSNLTATLLYTVGKGQEPAPVETSAQLPAVLVASALGWIVLALVLALARRVPGCLGTADRDRGAPSAGSAGTGAAALVRRGLGLPGDLGQSPTGAGSSSTSRTRGSGCRPRGQQTRPGRGTDAASWTRSASDVHQGKREPGALSRGPPRAGRGARARAGGWGSAAEPYRPRRLRAPCSRAPGAPGRPSRCPSPRRPRRRRSPPAALP